MSKNINQVFIANPITSNASTDLMYFGQSPYGAGNDAAMTYANFSAQFALKTLTSSHIFVGNASNVATDVAMSGDATIANTGALTLANTTVTAGTYTVNGTTLFIVDGKGRLTNANNITISAAPSGAAGGDLSGSYPNPTVAKINGVALGVTTATSGNLLVGSGSQWVSNPVTGDITFSSTAVVVVTHINGATLGTTTASSGNLLIGSGTQWVTQSMSGDATINASGALTLANTAVTAASYTVNGQALFTVDGKGRLTSASNATISGTVTNVNQTTSSATLAANSRYATNNGASLVTYTIPAGAAIGDTYIIVGGSSGGWKVAQPASVQCHVGNSATTSGVGGSIASSNQYDCCMITCVASNTFTIYSVQGNLTIV